MAWYTVTIDIPAQIPNAPPMLEISNSNGYRSTFSTIRTLVVSKKTVIGAKRRRYVELNFVKDAEKSKSNTVP